MATGSNILAWKIPQTEEPGGLQSMWSQRVRYDSMTGNTKRGTVFPHLFFGHENQRTEGEKKKFSIRM